MLLPGFQIYLQLQVTCCTFLWPPGPNVGPFHVLTCAKWHQNRFIHFQITVFTSLLTDKWTGGWSNTHVENIMSVSLAWKYASYHEQHERNRSEKPGCLVPPWQVRFFHLKLTDTPTSCIMPQCSELHYKNKIKCAMHKNDLLCQCKLFLTSHNKRKTWI